MADVKKAKMMLNIGRTKRLMEVGCGPKEIAEKLGISEITARKWIGIVKKAEKNKLKAEKEK